MRAQYFDGVKITQLPCHTVCYITVCCMKNTELETCHLMIYNIIGPCLRPLPIYNLSHLPKTTHEYSKLPPSSSICNKSLVEQGNCLKENEPFYLFIPERTIWIYALDKSFSRLGRDLKPPEKILNLILSRFARACTTIQQHKS